VPPDSLRRVLDEVFAQPEYAWAAQRRPFEWLTGLWLRFLDWLNTMQTAHPWGFRALTAVLIVMLAGMLLHVGFVVWRITRPTARIRAGGAGGGRGSPAPKDARAHGERAAELARAGRYAAALAHEFVALVLELERLQAVTFHPSKTPAEYVAEARLDPSGRASLADLVARLYRHLFGAEPCAEREYREFAAAAALVFQHVAPA
jgi:hypothetical protein